MLNEVVVLVAEVAVSVVVAVKGTKTVVAMEVVTRSCFFFVFYFDSLLLNLVDSITHSWSLLLEPSVLNDILCLLFKSYMSIIWPILMLQTW